MEPQKTAVIIDSDATFSLLKEDLQVKKITLLEEFISGREGLEFCLKTRPDLVLLGEISDPADVSVIEICKQIRENYPKLGIAFAVSLENLSKVLETLKNGASTFFIKPIDPEICIAEIESLLLQRSKILLIDDFVDNLEVLSNFLEDEYEVISASTARKGLALAIETKPDIVMLDIKLPEIDGMTVLKELKKSLPTVSVVMMTAFGSEDTAVDAMKQGASDYITKPFDLSKIKDILSSIAEKRTKEIAEDKLIERIKESEKRYSNLLQSMTEGVIRLDKDGNVSFSNKTASSITCMKELFKKRYNDFIDIEDPLLAAIIRNSLGTPAHYEFEGYIRRTKGRNVPISLSVSKLFEETQFTGSMLVFMDITARKALEAQIKEYTRTLEMKVVERTRELENFVFSVSHDLKSPLRAIEGYSKAIDEDFSEKLPDKGLYYLSRIQNNAKHLSMLISDLLDYTRIEREEPHLIPTDPREILEDVIEDLKSVIKQQECKITILYPDHFPPVIAENSRLYQVFLNLISNAIKFSRKDQENIIRVGYEERESEIGRIVMFFVQDQGVGFDMKYSSKVFTIFQRLHRTEDYEGTGVGLAIVKKQIEAMGGRIWAEAEEGKGACFFFELPRYLNSELAEGSK
ncbi:MAG: response regulator [Candidatus Odinarchaeota archaeon]